MAQSKPCVICLIPVTNYATLRCCGQPCHAACANECRQKRQTLICPSCQHVVPLSVLEVLHEQWKEDPEFVQQVKDTWKDNPLWYGICYENNDEGLEGFWGELRDPFDANRKTLLLSGSHQKPSHSTHENLFKLLVKKDPHLVSCFFPHVVKKYE